MKPFKPIKERLFLDKWELISGVYDIFELDFALWEYENMSIEEAISRSALFRSIDSVPTVHYQYCNDQNVDDIYNKSSFRTRSFFANGKYSTGYSTHSLFPYRGKFHPQLIRALMNVIGVKQGDIVLDPLSGSGTVSVEANMINADSLAVDISPFCCLMTRVKTFCLNIEVEKFDILINQSDRIFQKLNKPNLPTSFNKISAEEKPYYEIFLLAYLDAVGFSMRSSKCVEKLFPSVLNRYILTIKSARKAIETTSLNIGKTSVINGDARCLDIPDGSVDCVITSPPYSFAIDYVENDKQQLQYLRCDAESLKNKMIGLKGKSIDDKLEYYFDDISKVLIEVVRVIKKRGMVALVIGTNDIQTKGIRLESRIKTIADQLNLTLRAEIVKPIRGMYNSMKYENILLFEAYK